MRECANARMREFSRSLLVDNKQLTMNNYQLLEDKG